MTRRDAIVLLVAAGYTATHIPVRAQGTTTVTGAMQFDPNAPVDLQWNLGHLRNFIVVNVNGEKLVIPAAEVWKALKGEPR